MAVTSKELDSVAQNAHMLAGVVVVYVPAHIWGNHVLYYFVPAFIALAAIKEFWYDQHFEDADVRGSNLKDFLFYCFGAAMGLMTWFYA